MIDLKKLIEAYVHFGHKKTRWNPKMAPYIWGHRQGIHLIDVSKTARNLEKAAKFLEEVASEGKTILWVGTKKAAHTMIAELGQTMEMPYINYRWVGGMLTNYSQVRKSVTKYLHMEDVLARSAESHYTKKELNQLQKNIDRLKRTVGGIRKLTWPVGAVVIIDVKREATALKEAMECNIPVVALVDTNCDPTGIAYPIPGNDDSPRSIKIVLDYLAHAAQEGKKKAKQVVAVEESLVPETPVDIAEILLEDEEAESRKERAKRSAAPLKGDDEAKRVMPKKVNKPVGKPRTTERN